MSIWLCKFNGSCQNLSNSIQNYEKYNEILTNDEIYLYSDGFGKFKLTCKFIKEDNGLVSIPLDERIIDLPYTILYKTKASNKLVQLSESEIQFILNLPANDLPTDDQDNQADNEEPLSFQNFLYNSHQA